MKKIILILAICPFIAFGQGLTEYYGSFDIGWGSTQLSSDFNELNLSFTENSVRELPYSFSKNIGSDRSSNRIIIQAKYGKYHGFSHSLYFDVPYSDHGKGKFGYSLGYNYPIEVGIYDLLLRGSLGISTGEASYCLGDIAVDTTGIVIDDTDYIGTDVHVSVSNRATYLTPKLEVTFLIAQKYGLWAAVSYDHTISRKDQVIKFSPDDDEWDETKLNFDNAFFDFKADGALPTERVFDTNGINFSVGFSSYINRD